MTGMVDIRWQLRKHYSGFQVQVVNGMVFVTAIDVRDGSRYVVSSMPIEEWSWV